METKRSPRLRRPALAMLVGVLVGGAAVTLPVARHYNGMLDERDLLGVAEQVLIAREIRAGEEEALVTRIEQRLPGYIETVHARFGTSERALPVLWSARDFYTESGTEPPEAIRALLTGLPPRPPCALPGADEVCRE